MIRILSEKKVQKKKKIFLDWVWTYFFCLNIMVLGTSSKTIQALTLKNTN